MRKEMNFRDAGGMKTKDGKHIKKGIFFRCGSIGKMSKEELMEMKEYGIRYILDLRNTHEVKHHPDPAIEGMEQLPYSHCGTKEGKKVNFGFSGTKHTSAECLKHLTQVEDYYRKMPYHNEMVKVLFDALLEKKVPVVIHCASGKDRTGICCMLVQKTLGAADKDILDDYLQSNIAYLEAFEEETEKRKGEIEQVPETLPVIQMSKGVRKEIMESVLQELEQRYPDMETYLQEEYGYTQEQIAKIQEWYLEEYSITSKK